MLAGSMGLAVALPWNYMMAIALVYSLPPIAIYFALRRYVVAGLTPWGR